MGAKMFSMLEKSKAFTRWTDNGLLMLFFWFVLFCFVLGGEGKDTSFREFEESYGLSLKKMYISQGFG